MKESPAFISTAAHGDGSIVLAPAADLSSVAPAYSRVHISSNYETYCAKLRQTEFGRLIALQTKAQTSDMSGKVHGANFFVLNGSNYAFEVLVNPKHMYRYGENDYIELTAVRNVNDRSQNTYDRVYPNKNFYVTARGEQTPFTSCEKEEDWRNLTFYYAARYAKINYAAKKSDAEEYVIITTTDFMNGMCDQSTLYTLDLKAPEKTAIHDAVPGRLINPPTEDVPEMGIVAADYTEVAIRDLAPEICAAVNSYQGSKYYLNPANARNAVLDFNLKLAQ